MAQIYQIIKSAYPECEPIFGGHGNYGGHRAPRYHTISFRLKASNGKFCSNVVWLMPEFLSQYTVSDIGKLVSKSDGNKRKKRR